MEKSDLEINNSQAVKEIIRSYIYQAAHAPEERIMDESLIFEEGFLDSMGFIMMISFIEKEFRITTDDEDLTEENFKSINTITEYINQRLKPLSCVE